MIFRQSIIMEHYYCYHRVIILVVDQIMLYSNVLEYGWA